MPSLIIKNISGERVVNFEHTITLGRLPNNTVEITENSVSKKHAQIYKSDEGYVFEDLNSSNGSFYLETRIEKHLLKDKDVIRIGNTLVRFEAESLNKRDIESLVSFEQFDADATTEYKGKVEVSGQGHFLPASEVLDTKVLRMDYEKLRLGQELLEHINEGYDLKITLNNIAKQLLQMFTADRCVLLLLNKAGKFEVEAVASAEALDAPIVVSQTVLEEVKTSKNAVLLSESNETKASQVESLKLMGIHSVMCSPIISHGLVVGAIHTDLRSGHGEFFKKDLQLLGGISSYIAMVVANAVLAQKIKHETKMQAQFERLLSPNIVKHLISGRLRIGKESELRQVTIMFVDIRGFTNMSHFESPSNVVSMLNAFFEKVVEIVFKHGGTVDKYMGDAVMLLFGAPLPMKHQEDAALTCAVEIQQMLLTWNKERVLESLSPIPVGIGINSGEVVVGSIGSSQTMQYTCVGDAVNIASRLTSIAKEGQIIASKPTVDAVQSDIVCKALSPAELKGIEGTVDCFLVVLPEDKKA